MQISDKEGVQCALSALVDLCDDAKCAHDSLLVILPEGEKEKHGIWLKAKMICNDEFRSEVNRWLYVIPSMKGKKDDECGDDIQPEDSVSNVPCKQSSRRSSRSGKSTNSARII